MKAKVKSFEISVEPMTKFEYYDQILKMQVQHKENKRIAGFYCNGNGYKFGISKDNFDKIYTIVYDKEI